MFSRVISRGLLSLHFVRSAKHWAKNGDNTCSVHPTRCASNNVMSLNNVIIINYVQARRYTPNKCSGQEKKFCPSHKIYTCTLYASLFTNKQKTPNQKILKCIKKHQKIVGPLKMLTKI